MPTRRKFLAGSASTLAGALATPTRAQAETTVAPAFLEIASLCGEWLFRTDPDNSGTAQKWYAAHAPGKDWRRVSVPHTWQVEDSLTDYRGVSWYWRSFDTPAIWQVCAVRVEFEAVFHTATVWGSQARKRGLNIETVNRQLVSSPLRRS